MHRPCLNEEGGEQPTKIPNLSLRPLQVYTDIHIDAHANHHLRVRAHTHIKLKPNVSKYFFKVGDLGREGEIFRGHLSRKRGQKQSGSL